MPDQLADWMQHLPVFLLAVSRLGGIVAVLPVFGGTNVPGRVRALLAIGLAALVTPLMAEPHMPQNLAGLAVALLAEAVLGALIGLVLQTVFVALQLAGQLIAQEAGLAFSEMVDPSLGMEETLVGVFYSQLCMAVFLVVGGHRELFRGALRTFQSIPLLSADWSRLSDATVVLDGLSAAIETGVRIAAPVLLALLITNVALGFISRTVPQLNILTLGFAVKGLLAFAVMTAALPMSIDVFLATLAKATHWIESLGP